MNKIIIGALISLIAWEIGAGLAQRFETKVIIVAKETATAPESPAPKAPETAPPARKSPKPVQTAPEPQEPEKAQEEPEDWPPVAQVNNMSKGITYELPDSDFLIEELKLYRTHLWDRNGVTETEFNKFVLPEVKIHEDRYPPTFPYRARCLKLTSDLEIVRHNAGKGEEITQTNPWVEPYFNKTEIPPGFLSGEAYCYYTYDVIGLPNFNEEIAQIIEKRKQSLARLPKINPDKPGLNSLTYWETWWTEFQYLNSLQVVAANARGLRNRIRNIPTGYVMYDTGLNKTRYTLEWPEEFTVFIEAQAFMLDDQLGLIEKLSYGSR